MFVKSDNCIKLILGIVGGASKGDIVSTDVLEFYKRTLGPLNWN